MSISVYAGFWKRTAAFIIDVILAALPPIVIGTPLLFWQFYQLAQGDTTEAAAAHMMMIMGLVVLVQVLSLLSFWLYFALQESGKHQATFGKRLFKIKVVGKDGGRITFARATGRTFAKLVSSMIFYIGFIMGGLTNRKRALHDYIAETYVVSASVQPGDELPDTPSHPWWLVFISVLMLAFFALLLLVNIAVTQLPMMHSFAAASTLQSLAMQDLPYGTQTVNGVTYSVAPDGYRATFAVNGTDYTLYLADEYDNVCCVPTAEANCSVIGMDVCE